MASFEWQVPLLVVVIVAAIVYVSGRTRRQPEGSTMDPASDAEPSEAADDRTARPLSGAELIEELERTLGMSIVVESIEPTQPVEPGAPVTMLARLMYGRYTTEVTVTADSEAKAWEEVGRAAIAWRNSDFQHVQMWPGGG